MNVEMVMNRQVPVCRPHDSVDAALRRMLDGGLESLPVVDRLGHLVGVVSAEAARAAVRRWSGASHTMPVDTVMARQAPSCRPSDALGDVETTLAHYGAPSIPVIDDGGRFLGLVFAVDAPFTAAALRASAKKSSGALRAA